MTREPHSERLAPQTRLGPYEIEGPIGEGGMGVVYRALDTKFGRPVAIKFVSADLADAGARHRFRREAQTASSLNHPHILTVHDIGEHEGREYLVTEFVDGGTLREWHAAETRTGGRSLTCSSALPTASPRPIKQGSFTATSSLTTSSSRSMATPSSPTLVWPSSWKRRMPRRPRARSQPGTRVSGAIVGTFAYMSPEQAAGRPVDARSDVFSLGVVLYQLLSGRQPFAGATELEILQKIQHQTPDPLGPDMPAPLRMVVEKALEKDPADRYQTMRDMVVDLRRLVRSTVTMDAPAVPARSGRWLVAAAIVAARRCGWTPHVAAVAPIGRQWRGRGDSVDRGAAAAEPVERS